MENIDDINIETQKLQVTKAVESKLRGTSLFGIISACFGFFISLFILYQGSKTLSTIYELEASMNSNPIFGGSGMPSSGDLFTSAKIYGYSFILIGLIVLLIVVMTLVFSIQIRNSIGRGNQLTFEKSMSSLRNVFLLNMINCFIVTLGILFTFFLLSNGPRF